MATNWNPDKPATGEYANLFPLQAQNNWNALEDALSREHIFPGDEGSNAGQHSWLPSGTKMVFCQATAPPGWTQDTSLNDRVLRLVSSAGGGTGGDWTMDDLKTAGHALTVDEMPAHTHSYQKAVGSYSVGWTGYSCLYALTSDVTGSQGGNQNHDHDMDNSGNWRPAYVDVIVAGRD